MDLDKRDNTANFPGVYGVQGVPDPANKISARWALFPGPINMVISGALGTYTC